MALPATYDFTTAYDPLTTDSNWGQCGATTDSGKAAAGELYDDSANGNDKSAYWVADSFANDQYGQIVVKGTITGLFRLGIILRGGSGNEALLCRFKSDTGTFEPYYYNSSGSRISLGSAHTPSSTVAVGDIIRVEVSGTTMTLKVDYTGVGNDFTTETTWSTSASGITSGSAGLYIVSNDTTLRGDDWEGGNLGASGPSITDVNTTESWNDGDTGLVITGTGFI